MAPAADDEQVKAGKEGRGGRAHNAIQVMLLGKLLRKKSEELSSEPPPCPCVKLEAAAERERRRRESGDHEWDEGSAHEGDGEDEGEGEGEGDEEKPTCGGSFRAQPPPTATPPPEPVSDAETLTLRKKYIAEVEWFRKQCDQFIHPPSQERDARTGDVIAALKRKQGCRLVNERNDYVKEPVTWPVARLDWRDAPRAPKCCCPFLPCICRRTIKLLPKKKIPKGRGHPTVFRRLSRRFRRVGPPTNTLIPNLLHQLDVETRVYKKLAALDNRLAEKGPEFCLDECIPFFRCEKHTGCDRSRCECEFDYRQLMRRLREEAEAEIRAGADAERKRRRARRLGHRQPGDTGLGDDDEEEDEDEPMYCSFLLARCTVWTQTVRDGAGRAVYGAYEAVRYGAPPLWHVRDARGARLQLAPCRPNAPTTTWLKEAKEKTARRYKNMKREYLRWIYNVKERRRTRYTQCMSAEIMLYTGEDSQEKLKYQEWNIEHGPPPEQKSSFELIQPEPTEPKSAEAVVIQPKPDQLEPAQLKALQTEPVQNEPVQENSNKPKLLEPSIPQPNLEASEIPQSELKPKVHSIAASNPLCCRNKSVSINATPTAIEDISTMTSQSSKKSIAITIDISASSPNQNLPESRIDRSQSATATSTETDNTSTATNLFQNLPCCQKRPESIKDNIDSQKLPLLHIDPDQSIKPQENPKETQRVDQINVKSNFAHSVEPQTSLCCRNRHKEAATKNSCCRYRRPNSKKSTADFIELKHKDETLESKKVNSTMNVNKHTILKPDESTPTDNSKSNLNPNSDQPNPQHLNLKELAEELTTEPFVTPTAKADIELGTKSPIKSATRPDTKPTSETATDVSLEPVLVPAAEQVSDTGVTLAMEPNTLAVTNPTTTPVTEATTAPAIEPATQPTAESTTESTLSQHITSEILNTDENFKSENLFENVASGDENEIKDISRVDNKDVRTPAREDTKHRTKPFTLNRIQIILNKFISWKSSNPNNEQIIESNNNPDDLSTSEDTIVLSKDTLFDHKCRQSHIPEYHFVEHTKYQKSKPVKCLTQIKRVFAKKREHSEESCPGEILLQNILYGRDETPSPTEQNESGDQCAPVSAAPAVPAAATDVADVPAKGPSVGHTASALKDLSLHIHNSYDQNLKRKYTVSSFTEWMISKKSKINSDIRNSCNESRHLRRTSKKFDDTEPKENQVSKSLLTKASDKIRNMIVSSGVKSSITSEKQNVVDINKKETTSRLSADQSRKNSLRLRALGAGMRQRAGRHALCAPPPPSDRSHSPAASALPVSFAQTTAK